MIPEPPIRPKKPKTHPPTTLLLSPMTRPHISSGQDKVRAHTIHRPNSSVYPLPSFPYTSHIIACIGLSRAKNPMLRSLLSRPRVRGESPNIYDTVTLTVLALRASHLPSSPIDCPILPRLTKLLAPAESVETVVEQCFKLRGVFFFPLPFKRQRGKGRCLTAIEGNRRQKQAFQPEQSSYRVN